MSAAQIDELHARLRANDVDGAEQLLASGVPINSVVDENFTPLMTACLEGHVESVEMLLRQLPSPAVNLQNKVRSFEYPRGRTSPDTDLYFFAPCHEVSIAFVAIVASADRPVTLRSCALSIGIASTL